MQTVRIANGYVNVLNKMHSVVKANIVKKRLIGFLNLNVKIMNN